MVVAPGYVEGVAFRAQADFWRGEYDSARVWADSAVALDPSYLLGRMVAGQVAVERGDWARARASFDAAQRLAGDVETVNVLALSAMATAREGRREEARAELRRVDSLARGYLPTTLHVAVWVAEAWTALGEEDRALAWLRRYAPRADLHFQLHLRCDPPLAPLRNGAAFRALQGPDSRGAGGGCR